MKHLFLEVSQLSVTYPGGRQAAVQQVSFGLHAGDIGVLIGPSGSGKTLMCETLSRVLGVPFVTANATSLAQTRYVNDEIEAILQVDG